MAGSLAENIGAIVSGEAKPRAVVTYVMAGVTVALLLATTTWATILIRCEPGPHTPNLTHVWWCCSNQLAPARGLGANCSELVACTSHEVWHPMCAMQPPMCHSRGRRAFKRANLHLRGSLRQILKPRLFAPRP